jgi:putative hydrolase of the HAD superfamily
MLISSADFGLRKPHPAIYVAGCRALAVRPERSLYVGDRIREDVRGPKAAGLFGVLTREYRDDEVVTDEPDAVITSLRELPPIAERLLP